MAIWMLRELKPGQKLAESACAKLDVDSLVSQRIACRSQRGVYNFPDRSGVISRELLQSEMNSVKEQADKDDRDLVEVIRLLTIRVTLGGPF